MQFVAACMPILLHALPLMTKHKGRPLTASEVKLPPWLEWDTGKHEKAWGHPVALLHKCSMLVKVRQAGSSPVHTYPKEMQHAGLSCLYMDAHMPRV